MGSTGSISRESKKGTRNRRWCESEAAGRFDRAGESLVVLGKLWIYIYIYIVYISDLGIGD